MARRFTSLSSRSAQQVTPINFSDWDSDLDRGRRSTHSRGASTSNPLSSSRKRHHTLDLVFDPSDVLDIRPMYEAGAGPEDSRAYICSIRRGKRNRNRRWRILHLYIHVVRQTIPHRLCISSWRCLRDAPLQARSHGVAPGATGGRNIAAQSWRWICRVQRSGVGKVGGGSGLRYHDRKDLSQSRYFINRTYFFWLLPQH